MSEKLTHNLRSFIHGMDTDLDEDLICMELVCTLLAMCKAAGADIDKVLLHLETIPLANALAKEYGLSVRCREAK